ncbi:hypothetical protein [Mucilaginibacter celer]|uniref:Uncharacterized protein n=1 Tax=Mucilaginibacter celer TaxID=2305508 RepID=A0A494VSH9_9SPHI|nr:hypothetical protein [Mucilaginibacter celer]AYL94338.1 hypothetical protein HYN43_003070 [Mucilaginibacter celer]
MEDHLLKFAIEAHGGLERWNRIKSLNIDLSISGAIWYVKGRPEILKDISVFVETQQEKLIMTFNGEDKKIYFVPSAIAIGDSHGNIRQQIAHPVEKFSGHTLETPWEDVHVAYFSGEALWTYLTTPFLYTYPGFESFEIEPWKVNGETWRRLKVIFPDHISSHTREQISYFGPDGLLRRHDYTVDILGGATGANFASGYRNVDGLIFPTIRRVFAYESVTYRAIEDPLLVSIDMRNIQLNYFDE